MAILVTGSTGVIGQQILKHLNGSGAEVRALTRTPEKAQFPAGVTAVKGDLSDVDAVRQAINGVSTLFLLAPNAADELTQALQTLSVAREAGVKGVVYLSVFKGAEYVDVPHFTGKHTVERMIEHLDIPATVLRPAYFIQNDVRQKDPLLTHGVYGMPIGEKGISMVDVRDIGDAAARELLRRERADAPLPRETYELVGPDVIDAETVVSIWAEALGRPVRYGGRRSQRPGTAAQVGGPRLACLRHATHDGQVPAGWGGRVEIGGRAPCCAAGTTAEILPGLRGGDGRRVGHGLIYQNG